jgi:hypothetical protein
MTRWKLGSGVCAAVAIALAGCFPYSTPTLVRGGNIALRKPMSLAGVAVGAALCLVGANSDSTRAAQGKSCTIGPADTVHVPATLPPTPARRPLARVRPETLTERF